MWPEYLPTSYTYNDFLTEWGQADSPQSHLVFEEMFNLKPGVTHVPLKNFGLSPPENTLQNAPNLQPHEMEYYAGPPVELQDRATHGRLMSNDEILYDTTGQEGRNFLTATDRFHSKDADWYGVDPTQGSQIASEGILDPNLGIGPEAYNTSLLDTGLSGTEFTPAVASASASPGLLTSASGNLSIDSAPGVDAMYGGEGLSEALAAETAAEASGMTGPQMFAANMALNMIPTRDRKKVNTPLGDEGSMSGILKGTGKGALTGATIGSFFPGPGTAVGAVVGGGLGLLGGTQGYFDSTSPSAVAISRIKRGGGMQGGLLGGGSMYG